MKKLTLIGLGVEESDLSIKALNVIKNANAIVLRTKNALSSKSIEGAIDNVVYLDDVYKKSRNFDTLNKNLAKRIAKMLKTSDVCYCVDGSVYEDNSCKILLKKFKNANIISGVSMGAKCLERAKVVASNCTFCSAYDVKNGFKPTLPFVLYALDGKGLASEVKLILSDYFGEECGVILTSNSQVKKLKLYEIDRQKEYGYDTAIYFESQSLTQKTRFDYDDLTKIIEVLRGENGCPWDKAQTPESIQKNLIEECYELIDAVNSNEDDAIIEEIGDCLLQCAFNLQFFREENRFTISDVFSAICYKLISRHTHIFGSDTACDAESALSTWNKNKAIEKGYKSAFEYVDSVPHGLPSVMRAQKVGSRAGKYGFDFLSYEDALDALVSEIEEVKKACVSKNEEELKSECGDLLFSAVNTVRKLGVDGETALYQTINKFTNRFKRLEELLLKDGKNFENTSSQELDVYYKKVKEEE